MPMVRPVGPASWLSLPRVLIPIAAAVALAKRGFAGSVAAVGQESTRRPASFVRRALAWLSVPFLSALESPRSPVRHPIGL